MTHISLTLDELADVLRHYRYELTDKLESWERIPEVRRTMMRNDALRMVDGLLSRRLAETMSVEWRRG